MKYIITEEQISRLSILRRLDQNWAWINEIVEEGIDNDDPCDFRDSDRYLHRICIDSARTYLYNFYDIVDEREGTETSMILNFIYKLIEKRLGDDIIEYYEENKPDCQ